MRKEEGKEKRKFKSAHVDRRTTLSVKNCGLFPDADNSLVSYSQRFITRWREYLCNLMLKLEEANKRDFLEIKGLYSSGMTKLRCFLSFVSYSSGSQHR